MEPRMRDVRAELPSLGTAAYLNTGGCGPLPRVAARALADWAERAQRTVRGGLAAFEEMEADAEALRAAAGRVVGAPGERMALTANTTAGLNVALWGIDWRPGDEIVAARLEHPGLTVPLALIARRHGVTLRWVDPDGGAAGGLAQAVADACGPRTRAVALSHVSWATGEVLDVAGAARAARQAGALTLVDGAQSAGAIPVDAAALGVDAYAFPAHKWLLGPEGMGALWLSEEATERIERTASGYESGERHGAEGQIAPWSGARRHEVSTWPAALMPAWRASLDWMEGLGWDWIHARTQEERAAGAAALARTPGVRVLTPERPAAGLVTFVLEGRVAPAACAAIAEAGVVVRWLERPAALRASFGFFTDAADRAALVRAVSATASGGC